MIRQALADHKLRFDIELAGYFASKKAEYLDIDPTLVDVVQLIEQQVLRGGKRTRPLFANIGCNLHSKKKPEEKGVFVAGICVELIHQFLLIHDDIADRDEKRYGEKSLHEAYKSILARKYKAQSSHYGNALAMGAGDLVYVLALDALSGSDFSDKNKIAAQRVISTYLAQTVAGWTQQFFSLFSPIENITEEDYLRSTALVAAYYTVEGPLLVGTALAGNSEFNESLSQYAYHVGLAFQIQDDILGMFGKTNKTGKPVGNDFREGKKSILVIKAYEKASTKDRNFVKQNIGKEIGIEKLERVQKLIIDTGALDYSKQLAVHHAQKGVKSLNNLSDNADKKQVNILRNIAQFLVERDY